MRRLLRQSGVDYRVVKNTLARFAVSRAGREGLASIFNGPVAIAFGYGDITALAKLLTNYAQDSLAIKGGFLGDKLLNSEEVKAIATLPSREVLLARVVGGLQSPIHALLRCLTTPIQEVIGVLQSRIRQLEGG